MPTHCQTDEDECWIVIVGNRRRTDNRNAYEIEEIIWSGSKSYIVRIMLVRRQQDEGLLKMNRKKHFMCFFVHVEHFIKQ